MLRNSTALGKISGDLQAANNRAAELGMSKLTTLVGSMDQESSQKLQMWFYEHFFVPKLAA